MRNSMVILGKKENIHHICVHCEFKVLPCNETVPVDKIQVFNFISEEQARNYGWRSNGNEWCCPDCNADNGKKFLKR